VSRRVVWTQTAQANLTEAIGYLASEAPDYADLVVERIIEASEKLGFVHTGRPGRVPGYFEKSLPDIHYIIAYSFDRADPEGNLNIVRLIHTSRNWLPGQWPQ
jgi:plasmid stabilization system protein ParE